MTLSLLSGASAGLYLVAAALSLQFYARSRRLPWICIGAVSAALSIHALLAPFSLSPTCLLSSGLLVVCVGLIQRVFQDARFTEHTLLEEKRRLSMLVDRRVMDLETEIADRKRAEDALRQDGERFSAIIRTQNEIALAGLDMNAVMDLIAARAQELTGASGALIEIDEGDFMRYRAASGRGGPFAGQRVRSERSLSRACVRTGEILRCDDAERDARADLDECRRVGARSLIVVPLRYDRRVIGVLKVFSAELYAFDAMDLNTLQLMAGLIAASMSHTAQFEAKQTLLAEAIERADSDALTGLLNHRAFHKRLKDECARAGESGTSLAVAVLDLDNFKFFNDAYGHSVGDEVLRLVAGTLEGFGRAGDVLSRFGGDEFALLLPGVRVEELAVIREKIAECFENVGYQPPGYDTRIPLTLSLGLAVFPDEGATHHETLELADARLRRVKTGAGSEAAYADDLRAELASSMEGFSMLDALVTAVNAKDRYTHRHSENVLTYSLQIARELGLSAREQHVVSIAALLHDVGKIGVPDSILRKPGELTDAEFEAVKLHPTMGAVIVGAVPAFDAALGAIRHHHERWDGLGYPFGLRGEETPLLARLMAVADAFSAMTTDRPYRKGFTNDRALTILREGAGRQWDPECVHAFLRARGAAVPAALPALPLAA